MDSRSLQRASRRPHPPALNAPLAPAVLRALVLLLTLSLALTSFPALAQNGTPVADLGDAPDGTGHTSLAMEAYPGVPARYPTVFAGPEPQGPRHNSARAVWLGQAVSAESEADQPPDEDQITNIGAGGDGPADRDGADDGWLNRQQTVIRDCAETAFNLQISRHPTQTLEVERLFLNVWYDGNRDGDWADTRTCPDQQRVAFEWIVQNAPLDPALLEGGDATIKVPSFLVLDAPNASAPAQPVWMRFTLSEQPVPRGADGAPADGRGPPNGFAVGETEDYAYTPPTFAQTPGTLAITKRAQFNRPSAGIGDTIPYVLSLTNTPADGVNNPGPLFIRAVDALPAGVELTGGPTLHSASNVSVPLPVFHRGEGPSGTIRWEGDLPAGATITIDFTARVRFCTADQTTIRNELRATAGDQAPAPAVAEVPLTCVPPAQPPSQLLTKRILYEGEGVAEPRVEVSLPPGQDVTFLLNLAPTAALNQSIRISDTLPLGLVALAADASAGRAVIVDDGRTVLWEGPPSADPVQVKLRVRPTSAARCGARIQNTAYWFGTFNQGASNPTTLVFVCDDLGDAPDGSNHSASSMEAYPGVAAAFPTIFDSPEPRGPRHLQPRQLRLGEGVSPEAEADRGPDADGPNNLIPDRGRANLDRFDDGLRLDELRFTACTTATIPIVVSTGRDAAASAPDSQGRAYLNVWVDGNRDGDWADSLDCPNANAPAREHLVIDYPLTLADLKAGPQLLRVPTSGPVPWPANLAERPAWLRVTLSERPAPKLLPAGCADAACAYGDGRAFAEPYTLGETEDYLLLGRPADGKADPTVKKGGSIAPTFEQATRQTTGQAAGQARWLASWAVEYFNAGDGAATGVVLEDTLQGPQTRTERAVSRPPLTPTVSGETAIYRPGTLQPGQRGFISLQTTVPATAAPGTVITNTVVISAPNDVDPTNNTAVVTLTVPLLPPLILDPISGESCTGEITLRGAVQPGSTVQLFVDGAASGAAITPDGDGRWQAALSLATGEHTLYAVAQQGDLESRPSAPVKLTVDPSLSWSPISLRFTDEEGHSFVPRDERGEARAGDWRLWLRATTTYTVEVRICCASVGAAVMLTIPGVGDVSLTESEDTPGLFQGVFTTGERAALDNGDFTICVTCNLVRRCSDGKVLIDPLGVVYDATKGETTGLLADATVTCSEQTGETERLWPADQFGQVNPQTTGADGFYSFYTPPGSYRLDVSRSGYQPFRSEAITVIDAPVIFNVPLMPLPPRQPSTTVYLTDDGFEPPTLEVPRGAIVRWVNLTGDARPVTGSGATTTGIDAASQGGDSTAGLAAAAGWDSGLLSSGDGFDIAMSGAGSYTIYDGGNPLNTATITVASTYKTYLPLAIR